MKLHSLPDLKTAKDHLTVGKDYMLYGSFGTNGVIVLSDKDPEIRLAVLLSRFQEPEEKPLAAQ